MESTDENSVSSETETVNTNKTVQQEVTENSTDVQNNHDEKVSKPSSTSDVVENCNVSLSSTAPLTLTITVPTAKKRSRARDDLALSPDQSKIGKRQRKVNSIFSGFALDKKTSHVLGAENEEEEEEDEPEEKSPPKITKENSKEFSPLPGKRERRKPISPDFIETPKKEYRSYKKSPKPETPKIETPKFNDAPKTELAKQEKELSTTVQSLESQKETLERQLAALKQQINSAQQVVAKTEPPKEITIQPIRQSVSAPAPFIEITPLDKKKDKKITIKKKTVYDKFESDEDEYEDEFDDESPPPKKRGRKPGIPNSHGPKVRKAGRAQRSTAGRKKFFEEDGEDEDPELSECTKILHHLMKQQFAWPFLEPVDPVKLNIMDYFDVVKTPMDLGTIQKNLEAGEYDSVDAFASDVRLVWKNAMTYNSADNGIHKWALQLSQMFDKKMNRLQKKRSAPTPKTKPLPIPDNIPTVTPVVPQISGMPVIAHPPPAAPVVHTPSQDVEIVKAAMQSTITELRDSMKSVREEIAALRKEHKTYQPPLPLVAPPPPVYKGPGRPPGSGKKQQQQQQNKPKKPATVKETHREMTLDEKRQLSENINLLHQDSLGKIVQIIHQRMPSLAQNAPDEIEIDIDALDVTTLWHLDRYVKTTLTKQRKNALKEASTPKTRPRREASERAAAKKGEENDEVVIDDEESKIYPSIVIEKDKGSSSSSSSSDSDSSSSTDSESGDEKKQKEDKMEIEKTQDTTTAAGPSKAEDKISPPAEAKDNALASPVDKTETPKQDEAAPTIVQTGTQLKDVQLNNLDSWNNLNWGESDRDQSENKSKDENWSQMQKKDALNKQREKEREERERIEKEEREKERKKQDEQRLKELNEAEEKKKRDEEEEVNRSKRELLAKREAERKARQQVAERTVMDQSLAMADFEQSFESSSMSNMFKMKEESHDGNHAENGAPVKKEDGEL